MPARQAGGAGGAFCLCCGLFWFSGTEIGSRRPKNRGPRDPRNRINGGSTSVASMRPAALKYCATLVLLELLLAAAAAALLLHPPHRNTQVLHNNKIDRLQAKQLYV